MIYPLWQQVSCSHTGCPVMQYTPRLIFTPSLITLDSGVWMNLSSRSYCCLHVRKASDPELSSWTLLIGSCLWLALTPSKAGFGCPTPQLALGFVAVCYRLPAHHFQHAKYPQKVVLLYQFNGGPLILRQFVICVGILFFWRERVRRQAAARTTEQASNLLCGPFLSCQIELMIYPLWQQVSCSHTGCPVMQYTSRLIFTPSFITLDCGVWINFENLSSRSYCCLHVRKASDPELTSWTLLIGSCLWLALTPSKAGFGCPTPQLALGFVAVCYRLPAHHFQHAKYPQKVVLLYQFNGGPLILRQFVICVGVLFFWRERVRRRAAARTTEQASNLLCRPFLSCQIELMIYPLWQQVSCSHTGCPVMQYTPRLIFTPSLITLDCGVWINFENLSSRSYCCLHVRKASDPELSSWTLLIGSCLWLALTPSKAGFGCPTPQLALGFVAVCYRLPAHHIQHAKYPQKVVLLYQFNGGPLILRQFVICVGVLFFLAWTSSKTSSC